MLSACSFETCYWHLEALAPPPFPAELRFAHRLLSHHLSLSFVHTMLSIRSHSESDGTCGRKSERVLFCTSQVQGVVQEIFGSPSGFHLLDADLDLEAPSPLPFSITYNSYTTEWVDSDSDEDSDEDSDLDASEDAQCISIPAGNPFHRPPPAVVQNRLRFPRNTAPVHCVASPWQPASEEDCQPETAAVDAPEGQYISIPASSPFHAPPPPPSPKSTFDPRELHPRSAPSPSAAELFHAQVARIMPRALHGEAFTADAECLRAMDAALFCASERSCPDVPRDFSEEEECTAVPLRMSLSSSPLFPAAT
ncbi:hypothetical protein B0H10DRAFT_1978490 [Mycena sp. CBHHK59/15]|nr:hypothetical protein B0H10DRAFT_1978490 [Mycena sp. CBHHK59/15]